MAFPVVSASATGVSSTTNTTTHPVTLPSGSGGLVIVVFSSDSASEASTSSSGWTRLGTTTNSDNLTGTIFSTTGSSALTVATSSGEQSSHVSLRITGAGDVSLVGANGASTANPDPPALTPSGGSQDYLWILGLTVDASAAATNTVTVPSSYGTAITRQPSGTSGVLTSVTTRNLAAVTENPGTFTLGTAEQWACWTIAVAPAGGGGGGGGGSPGGTPAALHNVGNSDGLNKFNLGVGYPSGHVDKTLTQLAAGFSESPYYYTNAAGTAVVMSAPLNGGTTSSGTQYARTEYRELALTGDGSSSHPKASWNPSTGRHYMTGRTRVMKMPPNKPQLVIAQVHDAEDDTIMIRLESKTRVVAKFGDTVIGDLTTSHQIGTEYQWMIEVVDGEIRWYWDNMATPKFTSDGFDNVTTGQYFKAGCYNQSNTTYDSVSDGPFIIEMRDFTCWHTGYPPPQAITGPPTINAGSDAAATAGTTFTQIASENANGLTITSRAWTIESGPAGAGTTIDTDAALEWTPLVAGTYVLRYTAVNSSGTRSDDITVTVAPASVDEGSTAVYERRFPDGTAYPTIPAGTTTVSVSTSAALTTALAAATAGQRIVLADGTYSGSFSITDRSGTPTAGISIEAATAGGAVFASGSTFTISNSNYITAQGLSFPYDVAGDLFQFRGSSHHCRITRCTFGPVSHTASSSVANWIFVGDTCHTIRIDHNELRNKGTSGNGIRVYGSFDTFLGCKWVLIDHNILRSIKPEVGNDKEPIRYGVSTMSRTEAFGVIERNYLTDCVCEPELISVKMSKLRVSGNTMYRCAGGPVIRHGRDSVMTDNYVIDGNNTFGTTIGSGGFRFYDSGHRVSFNYMGSLSGTGAFQPSLLLDTGDAEGASTNLSAHWRVIGAVVERNVIANCYTGIVVGDNYSTAPSNCAVTNNITAGIATGTPPITYVGGITLVGTSTTADNQHFATTAAAGLVVDADGVYRKTGYGPRMSYIKLTDVGPTGDLSDADGTGGGTSSGGGGTATGAPVVSGGADTTVLLGMTLDRTAGETSSGVTARGWTLVETPTGTTTPPPVPETPPGGGAFTAQVFVATTGSSGNSGLSAAAPKQTIAQGLAIAQPGQTISVAAGTYTGNVTTTKGGTEPISSGSDSGAAVQTLGVGGIPTPAPGPNVVLASGDTSSVLNISTGGSTGNPRIYDGQGFEVGRINIQADWVTVQNYNIRANSQYGVLIGDQNNVTLQNCDIKDVMLSGDGDLNAISAFGNDIKILYNTADDYTTGPVGSSHTDFIQTWVSSSHPIGSARWLIKGNRATGPHNPSRDNDVPSIHQCIMAEGYNLGGNSGGNGQDPRDWVIEDNEFLGSWNQEIKLDGVDNVVITRNKFSGSSTKIMEVSGASSNVKYYSDNVVTGNYSNGVGMTVTAGPGPGTAPPTGGGGGTTTGGYITIRSATKHGAIISGSSAGRQAAVDIVHPYIRIEDFTITGTNGSGVRIGCLVDADNVQIVGNDIHNICQFLTGGTSYQGGAGIDFFQSPVSNILIDANLIRNIGLSTSTQQLVHGVYCGTHAINGRITNNVIRNCEDFGLHPYDQTEASGWQFINNTIAACGRGILQAPNGTTRNNIVYQCRGTNYDIRGSGNTVSNNIAFGGSGAPSGVTTIDPKFVGPSTGDFRLQSSSPALNAGSSTGAPPLDHVGTPRPQGTGVDIGAYENIVSGPVTPPPPVEPPSTSPLVLSTTAGLSWTPTTVGTYKLRYQATNSAGTSSDDIVVTVISDSSLGASPDFIAVSSGSSGASTAVDVTAPAGVTAGDFQICVIQGAGRETMNSAPAGWTLMAALDVVSSLSPDLGGPSTMWVYSTTTAATGAATWGKSGSRFWHAVRAIWRGQTALGQINSLIEPTGTGTTTHTTPAVTPVKPNSRVVAVLASDLLSPGAGPFTSPPSWTERYDVVKIASTEYESITIADTFAGAVSTSGAFTSSSSDEVGIVAFVLEGPIPQQIFIVDTVEPIGGVGTPFFSYTGAPSSGPVGFGQSPFGTSAFGTDGAGAPLPTGTFTNLGVGRRAGFGRNQFIRDAGPQTFITEGVPPR